MIQGPTTRHGVDTAPDAAANTFLLDSLPIPVWYLTDPYTHGPVNQAYATWFGRSVAELAFTPLPDQHPVVASEGGWGANERAFATGTPEVVEQWWPDRRGERRRFAVSWVPHREESGGAVDYVICSAREVTPADSPAPRADPDSSRGDPLHNLANAIPGTLLQYQLTPDGQHKLLYISSQVQAFWGVSQEAALADVNRLWARVDPDRVEALRASIRASAEHLTFWDETWQIRDTTGRLRWFNGRGQPQKQVDGAVVWDTLVLDVTELKEAESQLAAQTARLAHLLEATRVGTWEWNAQTGQVIVDERWAEMMGYSLGELAPVSIATWRALAHPADRHESDRRLQEHFRGERDNYELECRMRHRDGHWIWVLDRGQVVSWSARGQPQWVYGTHQDITARKRAEQENQRLLAIVEHGLNEIYLFDAQSWRFRYANAAALRNLGYGLAELTRLTPLDVKPEFDEPGFASRLLPLVEGEADRVVFETWHRRADGSQYPVEVFLQRLDLPDEAIFFTIINDITERHAAERALREREENLRVTLNSIGDAVIATDAEGRITLMNPVAVQLVARDLGAAVGRPLNETFQLVDARDGRPVLDPVQQVLTSGRTVGLANHTMLVAADGNRYPIADSAAPIRDAHGQITGVVLVFRDVTEEYALRQAVEQSNTLLQHVIEQSSVPMILVMADTQTVRLCSQACVDFAGWGEKPPPSDLRGTQVDPHRNGETVDGRRLGPEQTPMARALRGESVNTQEIRVTNAAGQVRHSLVTAVPIYNESKTLIAIFVIFPDITEQRRADQAVQRMQRLESLGTVAGGIAHDFNNLLMGIFGNLDLAMLDLPAGTETQARLQEAVEAIDSARRLTGQLLTFAKGGAPVLDAVDTGTLVRETVQFNLRGSNIETHLALPADLWHLRADKGLIGQVLANLTLNARDVMPEGGRFTVSGSNQSTAPASMTPASTGPWVSLEVADTGPGIPPELTERIFEPYVTSKPSGQGLGLAVVHSIVVRHGGHIRVDSAPGGGARFTLWLPAAPGPDPASGALKPEATAPTAPSRILVMDDEPLMRRLASTMLARLGHSPETVADGEAAVARYQEAQARGTPFAGVLMDLTVATGMGGREAMAELRRIDPNARVIVCSGYAEDSRVVADYTAFGFAGRLSKPYRLEDLQRELARVLPARPPA